MWSGELRLETGQAEDVELSFVDQTERKTGSDPGGPLVGVSSLL